MDHHKIKRELECVRCLYSLCHSNFARKIRTKEIYVRMENVHVSRIEYCDKEVSGTALHAIYFIELRSSRYLFASSQELLSHDLSLLPQDMVSLCLFLFLCRSLPLSYSLSLCFSVFFSQSVSQSLSFSLACFLSFSNCLAHAHLNNHFFTVEAFLTEFNHPKRKKKKKGRETIKRVWVGKAMVKKTRENVLTCRRALCHSLQDNNLLHLLRPKGHREERG